MKKPVRMCSLLAVMAGQIGHSPGQESPTKWNVELPPPIVQEAPRLSDPQPEPALTDFAVETSRTKRVFVSESPEMPDLPPVEGTIDLTIQKVENPDLPDPPPPLPALPPDDPAVIARLQELRETYKGTELVFLSASVHQDYKNAAEARTRVEIHPNGELGRKVVAWTNLNLLHLTGHGLYRVNMEAGTYQDYGILMGISPVYGDVRQRMAARAGYEPEDPAIPELPDLAAAGPSFVLVEGDAESPAYATLEQIHDLFRVSGKTLKDQYFAREQAREERRAYLLANPPKPGDVTVRVWKRTRTTQNSQEEAR